LLRDLVFFTLNDFTKDDGGTVRMYGILNAIAKTGKNVILISNASEYKNFHTNIKHVCLEKNVTKFEKKYLQFLLGVFPYFIVRLLTYFTVQNIKRKILYHNLVGRDIVFFEYLDNSIAYILKRLHVIDDYINDIHGVSSIEFEYKTNASIFDKVTNSIKSSVARKLDLKVFQLAKGYFFVSEAMQKYFEGIYPFLDSKKKYILRDGIGKVMSEQNIEPILLNNLKKTYKINNTTKVVFFAGDFKDLGGVTDLVDAFIILNKKHKPNNLKLILIGNGEKYNYIKNKINSLNLQNDIILVGRISYTLLKTYQELADVIVCPDKKHPYSNMVPHIKYFDSLVSNKIVINGAFSSTKEINKNEELSIDFEPSSILDLSNKIDLCLDNLDFYTEKFKYNKNKVCETFTYDRYVQNVL